MKNFGPHEVFGVSAADFEFGDHWAEVQENIIGANEAASNALRDEWGNWDHQHDQFPEAAARPSLDLRFRKPEKKRWPHDAPFVLCVTHDIDSIDIFSHTEYWIRFRRASFIRKFRVLAGYLKNKIFLRRTGRWSFQRWLALEARFDVKATWFVFPEAPTKSHTNDCSYSWNQEIQWNQNETIEFRLALKRLADLGHEVGLHGSINAKADGNELRIQRENLSAAIGREVSALRMHYLSFDPATSPAAFESAGFKVDSTLGFNRAVGFRRRTSFPFRLFSAAGNRLTTVWEVPLIVQEGALFRDWCLNLSVAAAKERILRIISDVEAVNGILTVVFHPDGIQDPVIEECFEWLLGECSRRNAWMPTVSGVIDFLEAIDNKQPSP